MVPSVLPQETKESTILYRYLLIYLNTYLLNCFATKINHDKVCKLYALKNKFISKMNKLN